MSFWFAPKVWKNIWVSEAGPAKSAENLKAANFTHVLNCSQGKGFGHLDTDEAFYAPHGLRFLGLAVADSERSNLKQFFEDAADYIHHALQKEGGKILVHCMEGFSRSPSIAAAYLIKYHGMSAHSALQQIRSKREVFPNPGFLKQLIAWETECNTTAQAKAE
mgnify:CR=1 FL=1